MPANLLEQVRCSRFRPEPANWEHIGYRWRGALALFDFQPQLSLSTICFTRAYAVSSIYVTLPDSV